jgi:ankyrin repeat protein
MELALGNKNKNNGIEMKSQIIKNKMESPLFKECDNGNWAAIKYFLTVDKISPNIKQSNGRTLLQYAICRSQKEIALGLLEIEDLNVNYVNPDGFTALNYALATKDDDIIIALFKKGSLLPTRDIYHIFNLSGSRVLDYMLENSSDFAIEKEFYISLRMVLDKVGHVINEVNDDGQTVLHRAVIGGFFYSMCLLLHKGADPEIKDKDGNTPLMLARKEGKKRFANYLALSYRFSEGRVKEVEIKRVRMGGSGVNRVLKFCVNKNDCDDSALFIIKGSLKDDLERHDQNGMDISMMAARRKNMKIIQALVEKDIELDAVDVDGNTIIHHLFANKKMRLG